MIFQIAELPVWAGAALIFFARVSDVTLGTLRISFISRGEKSLAPVIGFFEILIWLFAISQVVQNLNHIVYLVAYAAGFSTGVFTGLQIEDRLARGSRIIRTITRQPASELLEALRAAGYGVTTVRAQGMRGEVDLIFSVVQRSHVGPYMAIVNEHNPAAFTSVEDVRSVREEGSRMGAAPGSLRALSSALRWKSK
ncbi:MAG: DUF2179 domain-containing protein [Gemmatimonadetes bacterium]|jgi:uncharacterized protein YebE (UPF0316 family)|nr:DUF2179 domain-containing protein [Gemmatimonadota bacterium]